MPRCVDFCKFRGTGREQTGWAKQCRCTGSGNGGGGCGAHLLVDESDVRAYRQTDMMGDSYGECVTFTCPECGVDTDLKVDRWQVPRPVWDRVWKRQQLWCLDADRCGSTN